MANQDVKRKEHETVRNKVGFFDFAHDILEVTGKDARDFLDYVCVNVISDLEAGEASYTTILDKDAIALDDVIVFYHGDDRFWVSTLFIDELLNWFKKQREKKENRDVNFNDVTSETALYSVQGPNSRKVMNDLLEDTVDDLGYFRFKENKLKDKNIDVIVSRTGFTGELGFELYFHPKYTDDIIEELNKKGKEYGIEEITTDVTLTSLPAEKGYITVDDFEGANPIELDLAWSVDCDKDFIGKDKLCKLKNTQPERKLIGFELKDTDVDIEKDDKVKVDGKEIGEVTTFTYGYTVEEYIGYVLIDYEYAKEGNKITIVHDGKEVEATLANKVFYDPEGERIQA